MRWLSRLFHRRKQEAQLDSELRFHIEQQTADNIAAGMNPDEARRRALAQFGGLEYIKEEARDARGTHFVETLLQDIRFALRMLRKSPGFTAVAVLTLALGIGANTTIFSVAEAYFLRPLPGRSPQQLVTLTSRTPQGEDDYFSFPDYRDIERENSAFSGILAYSGHAGFLNVRGNSPLIAVSVVSRNYFEVLGVNTIRGRTFSPASSSSSGRSIILSYAVWQADFGGDPTLVGKSITLTNKNYTVIGIAPPSFRGLDRFVPADAWLPTDIWYGPQELDARGFRDFQLVGRLRPNVGVAQIQTQLVAIGSRLASAYPATNAALTFGLISENERFRNALVPAGLLLAVTGLVLLIACANIAGLLVARSEARHREIAIRLAIGASRWRLVRQLLTESAILGAAGAGVAILISKWLIGLQPAFLPPAPFQIGANLRINGSVAAFTFAIAVVAVLIFGLVPAVPASKMNLVPALKSDGGSGGLSSRRKIRNVFVVVEVTLAVVLLSGAGLLLRSLEHTFQENLGFDAHRNLLLVDLGPGIAGMNPQQSWQYFERVSSAIGSLPGVKGATFALRALLSDSGGGRAAPVSIPGVVFPQGQPTVDIKFNSVAPGYFRAVGTEILQGRAFSSSDGPDSPKVVIVDNAMVHRFWPKGDAVGKTIEVAKRQFQIVGIAENAKINSVHESSEPYMYFPFSQQPDSEATLIVETARSPRALFGTVRQKVRSINARVPIAEMMSLDQLMQQAMWNDRVTTELVVSLSLLGMFLGAIGLYGVVAYLVTTRTREIGVRMALGAQHGDILHLVVSHGLKLAAIGVGVGLVVAVAAGQLMASFLYGVSPRDPTALAAASIFALGIAFTASYIPARRAMRVDPMVALRYE
jgi:predicted permease